MLGRSRTLHAHLRHYSKCFRISRLAILSRGGLHTKNHRPDQSLKPAAPATTLTALYRTVQLLPNALPEERAVSWSRLLQKSSDILSGVKSRKARIAIIGLDELSQSNELISVLLEDPLTVDDKTTKALRNQKLTNEVITFSDGDLEVSPSYLRLNSPWLRNIGADITEIPLSHPNAIPLLHDADIQLLVASPISPPLSPDFRSLLMRPGFLLALQYPTTDQMILMHTIAQLTQLYPSLFDTLKSKTLFVYTNKALASLDFFRQTPKSLDAIQTFQNGFLSSGITDLTTRIHQILSTNMRTLGEFYVKSNLVGAMETCQNAANLSIDVANSVQYFASKLRSDAMSIRKTAFKDILGEGTDDLKITHALEISTKEMESFMKTMAWWKLPFKIDDLGHWMINAIETAWCRGLREHLEFQTGGLAVTRSEQISTTFKIVNSLPKPYNSSVLVNELQQLSSRPPEMAPSLFTYPILYRRRQLEQPILKFHRYTQRSVFLLLSLTMTSMGGSYICWLLGHVSSTTATGVGILGSVLVLRWFIARWEKGKRRWWQDWSRAGQGLERDIKEMLNVALTDKVLSVPLKAAAELEKMIATRIQQAEQINTELQQISNSLDTEPIIKTSQFLQETNSKP